MGVYQVEQSYTHVDPTVTPDLHFSFRMPAHFWQGPNKPRDMSRFVLAISRLPHEVVTVKRGWARLRGRMAINGLSERANTYGGFGI